MIWSDWHFGQIPLGAIGGREQRDTSQEAVANVQMKVHSALDLGFGRKNEEKWLDKGCPFWGSAVRTYMREGEGEKLNMTSGSDWKDWVDGGAIYWDGDN